MSCQICEKYQANFPIISELDGVMLTHIAPGDNAKAMKGRLVIEPKRHVTAIEDLTAPEFANMGILLQKAMLMLKNTLGAEHVYFFRINDLVNHFHFHVVPRYPGTPKEHWGLKIIDWANYPQADIEQIHEISVALK